MDWAIRSVDVLADNKLFTKALTMSFLIAPLKTRSEPHTHTHTHTHKRTRTRTRTRTHTHICVKTVLHIFTYLCKEYVDGFFFCFCFSGPLAPLHDSPSTPSRPASAWQCTHSSFTGPIGMYAKYRVNNPIHWSSSH